MTDKSKIHLVFQGSIPVESFEDGIGEYNDLKEHLKSISPEITIYGQIVSQLEPCCGEKERLIHVPKNSPVL